MRYLPTLLLTTSILITEPLFASADIIADSSLATSTATSIPQATQAQIDALETLIRPNEKKPSEDFKVSNAAKILFSPELYPFISWRSPKMNNEVLKKVGNVINSACEGEYDVTSKVTRLTLFSIALPDCLENIPDPCHRTEGVENPTRLNTLVDGTQYAGHYDNVLSRISNKWILTPAVRLQIYLELLHQTNITSDSLGHILRKTTDLMKIFLSKPQEALYNKSITNKDSLTEYVEEIYSSYLAYSSLKDAHTPAMLAQIHVDLLNQFSRFENTLDKSLANANAHINQILKSFGSLAIEQFEKIFKHIATHPNTKIDDKIKAAEMLMHTNTSSTLLIELYTKLANDVNRPMKSRMQDIEKLVTLNAIQQTTDAAAIIANDSAVDIRTRLNATAILLKTKALQQCIDAYNNIISTINLNFRKIDEIASLLLEVGLGLHNAGAINQGLGILSEQYAYFKKENDRTISPPNLIAAAEILFNAGKLEKSDAIETINWAVYCDFTTAFSCKTIILGAETAQRIGDIDSCRKILDHLKKYMAYQSTKDSLRYPRIVVDTKDIQARITALEAKL